ncbi:DNA polymerase IV, partial [candidate division KSB1 bacterium]|nr:DNA polymerase IV [candidate division KSB1 bacterium]
MNRVILHIDMDAFFAAVEQMDHPEYRDKPVIVGADPKAGAGRGVVSTCSYEARKFGIHSAMPISQAYKRCPHGIYLRGRMERYQELSRRIMKIMQDFSPAVEPVSIDEAFIDITGCIKLFGEPRAIAQKLKDCIKQQTGLTASVGVAPSKFVAKIASDLEKPNGLVIVEKEKVKDFLRPLPISRMWGVGKKTEPVMQKLGIQTIGDLADYSQSKLIKYLGKAGVQFWNLANGIDNRTVVPYTDAKSLSHETTYHEDTDDTAKLKQTIFYLSNEVSRGLRKGNMKGKTITLKIRLADFSTFTRSKSFIHYINSSKEIYDVAMQLFDSFNRMGKKVRLLGVAVSNLDNSIGEQMSMFDD